MSEGKTPPGHATATRLDERIDVALGNWPMVEKGGLAWDESADAIMARARNDERVGSESASRHRVSDEALLAPPLAQTPEEVQNSAALGKGEASPHASNPSISVASEAGTMGQSSEQSKRAGRRQSLKELAELARNSQPGSGFGLGSGVHRAGESQGASLFDDDAQAMRPSAPPSPPSISPPSIPMPLLTAAQASFDEVAATESYAPALPASIAPPANANIGGATARPQNETRKRGAWLYGTLGVGAVAAAAAGLLFVMRGPLQSERSLASTPDTQATTTTGATTGVKPIQAAPEVQLQEGDPGGTQAVTTAAGTLPLAPQPLAQQQPLLPFAPNAPNATSAPTAPTAAAKAEPNAATAPTSGADTATPAPPAPAAPGDTKSLQDQMRQAAGQSAPSAPAVDTPSAPTGTPQNVPMKPSQGAASGAVGAVLYSARACLGPDDAVSQATIVFQSSGAVQSVSVSGGAAGKPQEACIKQALGRAKVAPFAQPSFAFSVTIRPN